MHGDVFALARIAWHSSITDHSALRPSSGRHDRKHLRESHYVSKQLTGNTIRARNRRRKELLSILHDRQKLVDTLLQLKQGPAPEEIHAVPRLNRPANPLLRHQPIASAATVLTSQRTGRQAGAMVAIYGESSLYATCSILRFFVNVTATESIQMQPRYLVIGMKKFVGYAIRLNEESPPVVAASIPRTTIHRGISRVK